MREPVIHYDRLMGGNAMWRRAIVEALRGHPALLEREYLDQAGYQPAAARVLAASYGFAQEGQQCFGVGPKMGSVFRDTEITSVPAEFLHFPFNCFYVAMPESDLRLYNSAEQEHQPVHGFYLHKKDEALFTLLVWAWDQTTKKVNEGLTLWLDINLEDVPQRVEGDDSDDNDRIVMLDMESYLQTIFADPERDVSDPGLTYEDPAQENAALTCLRIGLNLVLYLNSVNAETTKDETRVQAKRKKRSELSRKKNKTSKKSKKLQARLDEMSEAVVIWVGKTYEQAAEAAEAAEENSGRTTKPHRRRGHPHHYWVGPRKDDEGNPRKGDHRVLKFVLPTWVNVPRKANGEADTQDVLDALGRQYRFREEKKDWNGKSDRPQP